MQGAQIEDIDFRRGEGGAGKLEITFEREVVSPGVKKSGRDRAIVDLHDSTLPDALNQVYDVTDFGTPVTRIVPHVDADGTTLELVTDGPYAMMTTQTGRVATIEVQPAQTTQQSAGSNSASDAGSSAKKSYSGKRLSLNFQDIEVRAVLSTLAKFTGLNIVASDSVSGRVTLNLNDVPWDQALALILQSKGLDSRKEGNVMVVADARELAEMERQKLEARSQHETLSPLVTKFIKVKYARAKDLAELLKSDNSRGGEGSSGFGLLTERGRVAVDKRTNTLMIQDTAKQVDTIISVLDHLDVSVRQVQIEARIVIARDTASRELGVNWGLSGGGSGHLDLGGASDGTTANGGLSVDLGSSTGASTGFGFGYLSGDVLLDLELKALESEGKSQTISQPRIITANRRTATISQGEERAYQSNSDNEGTNTEFKEALLSLEVTPQITPDDRIIMDLVIHNDSFRESSGDSEPPIDTNTIETQVLVDNGQTVVLGGILTTEELRQIAKTPLLGDLPVIGKLFRYTEESNEKVELLVFITPRLLDEGMAVR
ncbi:MAG: type IV pilus secretin PilQ [Halomonas subglaciescola]|nr:type IV pilus secretin PilQ [Halomonas subglaciescola]